MDWYERLAAASASLAESLTSAVGPAFASARFRAGVGEGLRRLGQLQVVLGNRVGGRGLGVGELLARLGHLQQRRRPLGPGEAALVAREAGLRRQEVRLGDGEIQLCAARVRGREDVAGRDRLPGRDGDGLDDPRGGGARVRRRVRARGRGGARRDGRSAAEGELVGRAGRERAGRGHLVDDVGHGRLAREVLGGGRAAEVGADDGKGRRADPDHDEQHGAERLPAHWGTPSISLRAARGGQPRA